LGKKQSLPEPIFRGRFAPSPTGPLHFGSLVAAIASYLEAKHHHGVWLVRMENLDMPRTVPGAADDILQTLDSFGLHSDEPVIYQSQRTDAYQAALQQLKNSGVVYSCNCTRKEIADSAIQGIEGAIYPGTCRGNIASSKHTQAWRVYTDLPFPPDNEIQKEKNGTVAFDDTLQGHITQDLAGEIGDFVVKRADGLFAYQLAVVVDDASQRITNVVRGCDLLASTPRQIHLQHLLGLPTPHYMHLPIAVNAQGEKLSKQTLAPAVSGNNATEILIMALEFLRQNPPAELRGNSIEEILSWATTHWQPERLKGHFQILSNFS